MDLHELLQIWRRRFLAASVVFTLLLSGLVILAKYEQSAKETVAELMKLGGRISLMRAATVEMKQSLAGCRALLPPGYADKTEEALLFDRVDDLKRLFPKGQITIAAPSTLPDGVAIPFSINILDSNYTGFLNALSLLQSRTFPFVLVRSITLGYDQPAKGTVVYKVDGTITTPSSGKSIGAP